MSKHSAKVKIKQIATTSGGEDNNTLVVVGISEDGTLYRWDFDAGKWRSQK